jgi:16S rRNA (adenine1518-N6/adenine1519-N6)-dimethyltransferase
LQDTNISRKIVDLLHIESSDKVMEIGPGPGMLTGLLQDSAASRLCLVEKDEYWAAERQKAAAAAKMPCEVILADALATPWSNFADGWKVIGNLPYNVASPLMWDILSQVPGLRRAVFMVQKEVALRLKALPGSGAYGALSVWVQSYTTPRLEFTVPPQVFIPRPKVHSAVVSFAPLAEEARPKSPQTLSRLLKLCFQMRRKQLGVILRSAGLEQGVVAAALEAEGIRSLSRPEELSPGQFQSLALRLFESDIA